MLAAPDGNAPTNSTSRSRDEKSATLTLALQAAQQFQTQQRAALQAMEAMRAQNEAAAHRYEARLESIRRLLLTLCVATAFAIGAIGLSVRSLSRRLSRADHWSGPVKCPLNVAPREHDARAGALLTRGQTLLEQKHPLDALGCFEQALALGASAEAFIKKGVALERLGRLKEALASYEQALALDESNPGAYIGKGNVLNRLERYQEALRCFERAGDHQPHAHPAPQRLPAALPS